MEYDFLDVQDVTGTYHCHRNGLDQMTMIYSHQSDIGVMSNEMFL